MIKLLIKTTLFTLLFISVSVISKAQIGYDYAQYDLAIGGTLNRVYGDAESIKTTPAGYIGLTFNQTPYVNYIVEAQIGRLEGGSDTSKSGRYFRNNYKAFVFRVQLQAGEFIDYSRSAFMNGLKNFYVSAGFGYLVNDLKTNRISTKVPGFVTGGLDKSNELTLPLRLGYEIKFFNQYNQPSFKIDLAAQYNHDFGDNMDGFDAGKSKDALVQFSLGFKFALGGVTSYSKQINY